jgi:hypothetical protein
MRLGVEWRGTVAGTESSFTPLLTKVQLAPMLGTALPNLRFLLFVLAFTRKLKFSKSVRSAVLR